MQHQVTISTERNKIFFFTKCEYSYVGNDSAQIKFEYEGDFSKYNIVIGVNRNKLSLAIASIDEDGNKEGLVQVLPFQGLLEPHNSLNTTVTFEYLKFAFMTDTAVVDYNENFAKIAISCRISKSEREEGINTVLRIEVK